MKMRNKILQKADVDINDWMNENLSNEQLSNYTMTTKTMLKACLK